VVGAEEGKRLVPEFPVDAIYWAVDVLSNHVSVVGNMYHVDCWASTAQKQVVYPVAQLSREGHETESSIAWLESLRSPVFVGKIKLTAFQLLQY
jgi:hypothetical protein